MLFPTNHNGSLHGAKLKNGVGYDKPEKEEFLKVEQNCDWLISGKE